MMRVYVNSTSTTDELSDKVTIEGSTPEDTSLHELIRNHYNSFKSMCDQQGKSLASYVQQEFESYLQCGILSYGFLRVKCCSCQSELLLGFSCKGRGFCPSCMARYMSEKSALLVDYVIPHVPVRQWVVTFPHALRFWMSRRPSLQTSVLSYVIKSIHQWIQDSVYAHHGIRGQSGFISMIQRFGGSLNINPHIHILATDGGWSDDGTFYPIGKLSTPEVSDVLDLIIKRLLRFLRRSGYIDQENNLIKEDEAIDSLDNHVSFSVKGQQGTGSSIGQPLEKIGKGFGYVQEEAVLQGKRCLSRNGFSIHANTSVGAYDREKLERLCRYILRPAFAYERLSKIPESETYLFQLKRPWKDGTTHIKYTAMEFLSKLSALVPLPRHHLIRFSGVFAPNSKIRKMVVPKPEVIELPMEADTSSTSQPFSRPYRIAWANLIKRVFKEDVTVCKKCKGAMKIIAAILKWAVIEKILSHLGLPTKANPIQPADQMDFGFS